MNELTHITYVHTGDSVHVYSDSIARIKKGILCIYTEGYLVGSFTKWDYHRRLPIREALSQIEQVRAKNERDKSESQRTASISNAIQAYNVDFQCGDLAVDEFVSLVGDLYR